MEHKHILIVIDELGALIEKHKEEIKFKDLQIDNLKKKITEIENYLELFGGDNERRNVEAS